jgi:hypothetical protein
LIDLFAAGTLHRSVLGGIQVRAVVEQQCFEIIVTVRQVVYGEAFVDDSLFELTHQS